MKKMNIIVLSVFAAAMLLGCATTSAKSVKGSGMKGKSASVQKNYVKIVDYQGASFGSEIPEWVVEIGNGQYSPSVLSKVMPDVNGKKIFVTIGRGDNLEFVREWTDLVDVENKVGAEMSRVVGKAVEAVMSGSATSEGDTREATQLVQELNMVKEAVSAVEVNGLEQIASYWIQKEVKKTSKSTESKVYYEYYAVWGINQKLYNSQINSALSHVSDNTDESKALKAALSKKLQNLLVGSNDDEISETAADELEDL